MGGVPCFVEPIAHPSPGIFIEEGRMTFRQFLDQPRIKTMLFASLAFAVIFFILNVFVIGGIEVYKVINAAVPSILALSAVFLVFMTWRDASPETSARTVWAFLLAGMAAWACGDVAWTYFALLLHVEVPYPSGGDALWVVGYFLLYVGLYTQFRAYHTQPGRGVWVNIGILALVLLGLSGFFVVTPLVQVFSVDRLFEGVLNVSYILLDLVLISLCFLIMGTLSEGKLAFGWRLIAVGFLVRVASDLLFSYITWQGLYMPGDKINLISGVYDFIYASSYLVVGFGFFAFRFLMKDTPQSDPQELVVVEEQPGTPHNLILVSTDGANKVISFSDNLLALIGRRDGQNIKGASLYEVLGMTDEVVQALEADLHGQGIVDALLFPVPTAVRKIDVRLSALAVYYEGKSFKGANIVLATLSPLGVADNLSAESQGVIRSILLRTGNPQKEVRAALSIYFNAQLRMLDDLVRQYGGRTVAQTMRMVINETAMQSGWLVRKDGGDFVILDQADPARLADAMSALLAAARAYGVEMVGAQMVAAEVNRVNDHMNPGVMKAVDDHGLRLAA